MRHAVNFGLLFTFLTLAITGVMAFTLPFSIVTTRVHIVAGLTTLFLVLLHLLGRTRYFQTQLGPKKPTTISKGLLFALIATWGGILAAAMVALPPIPWLMVQSYEAQHRAEIVRVSSLVGFLEPSPHRKLIVRKSKNPKSQLLSVYVSLRDDLTPPPSVAVWAETTTGTMIETLYLPEELSFSEKVRWHGALENRNFILPIWRNRYTAVSGVGPDGKVDAVTGATQTHKFALDSYLVPNKNNKFIICVEVNAPHDTNSSWPDKTLGQPSLLYTALIQLDNARRYTILELTAHGGGAENNGNLQYDLDDITSAKNLIDLLLVKIDDAPNQTPSNP